jgi:hypothetical protein
LNNNNKFILGNIILGVALLMLWYMGALWEYMGAAAMGLWIAVTGLGAYLVSSK